MELLNSLLSMAGEEGITAIKKACSSDNALHSRLIMHIIAHPEAGVDERIKALRTTRNTYNKTSSIAKDIVWEKLKAQVATPFDDIYLLQQLLLRGELDAGERIYASLEKDLEQRQAWQLLDALYIEGFRLMQIKGDAKKVEIIARKRTANAKRLAAYIALYSDVIVEMVKLEGYKTRRPEDDEYVPLLVSLYDRAKEVGHHVLVHNTLHLLYLYYMRYTGDHAKVWQVVQDMKKNAERHRNAMNVLTRVAVECTYINFLTICVGYDEPDNYAKKLLREIDDAGKWMRANLCYAMLEYNVYEGRAKETEQWLKELEAAEDNSKFAQYRYVILAIRNFAAHDFASFRKNFNSFYDNPSHLDFPDVEVTLRLLEIGMLLFEKENKLAEPKLSSLRMYITRNLDEERYAQEKKLLAALSRFALNNDKKTLAKTCDELQSSVYRSIRFLVRMLQPLATR